MPWYAVATLLLASSGTPAPSLAPAWAGGRVHTSPNLHVGVRPAAFFDDEGGSGRRLEVGAGVTVQVSLRVL